MRISVVVLLGVLCAAAGAAQTAGAMPAGVPAKSLQLWLKADGEVGLDGSAVVRWSDMSGRGNHAERNTGPRWNPANPVLVRDGFHGKPVLRFDGSESSFSFRRIPDIRTVFLVVSKDAASFGQQNQRFILGDSESDIRYVHFHVGTHKTAFLWHESLSSPFIRDGQTRLNGALLDGTVTEYPKTMGVISLVTTGNIWANQLSKDRDYKDGHAWQGDIAEILIYNVALPDRDREGVERYLLQKYGIPKAGPSGNEVPPLPPTRSGAAESAAQTPPPFYVSSVAFSPDGKTVAAGGFDESVRVWDVDSWKVIRTLAGNKGGVTHVGYSPDGRILAASGVEPGIHFWDARTGEAVRHFALEARRNIWSFAFSPDSRTLLSVNTNDGLRVGRRWNLSTGEELKPLEGHKRGLWWVAVSPDGARIATSSGDGTLRLWDAATGEGVRILETRSTVLSFAFSPDGTTIAAAAANGALQLWDVARGSRRDLWGHTAGLMAVAFSPNGRMIATGSDDGIVGIWGVNSGKLQRQLRGHSGGVWSVAFRPDGKMLASGSRDNTVKFWDPNSGRLLHNIAADGGGVDLRQTILTQPSPGSPLEIRKPDQTRVDAATGPVATLAYSPDGNTLATADGAKAMRLWDLKTGKPIRDLSGHTGPVSSVAFSPDGKTIATSFEDQSVKIWNTATGEPVRSLAAAAVGAVAFQPGASSILAACTPAQAKLWDYASGETGKAFELTGTKSCSIAFGRDGKTLAVGTDDRKVRLWDVANGAPIRTVDAGSSVRSVAVSVAYVAAGCSNGNVKVSPLDSAGPVRELSGHREAVHAVAFSPDGSQLASASADKTIKIWDAKTGNLLSTLDGHTSEVLSVAFSPNGRTIASGGADRTVRYWTIPLPPISPEDVRKIEAAVPSRASVTPKKPRRVLVFWRADAIQHKSGVPAANKAIELMAKKTGAFAVDFSRDYDVLDPKVLARYDAIVMNSTAHLAIPDEAKKKALLDYVRGGGGVVGIHAAIDTFKDWPAGAEVIGATFGGHPFVPTGNWAVKIEEPDHPLMRAFAGKGFIINDEIYEMDKPFTRADRRVLMSLDLADPATAAITRGIPGKEPTHRPDKDFAVSWVKRYGAGKVFYAVFGHITGPFQNPAVLQFYLDGIQYAVGDLDVDDTPKIEMK